MKQCDELMYNRGLKLLLSSDNLIKFWIIAQISAYRQLSFPLTPCYWLPQNQSQKRIFLVSKQISVAAMTITLIHHIRFGKQVDLVVYMLSLISVI